MEGLKNSLVVITNREFLKPYSLYNEAKWINNAVFSLHFLAFEAAFEDKHLKTLFSDLNGFLFSTFYFK